MKRDEREQPLSGKEPISGESDTLWQALDDWKLPEPGEDFDASVMARIRQEESAASPENPPAAASSWLESWRWLLTGRAWAVSGVLAAVLLAVVILRQPPEVVEEPGLELSAQQVEWALEDLEMLEELYGLEDGQSNVL